VPTQSFSHRTDLVTSAAVINADRALSVIDVAVPPLGPNEVRVDVAFCGLCGSDLHIFFDAPEPMTGHILGHEFSGVVADTGADVTGWTAGDRVVIRPVDTCRACKGCRSGDGVCVTGLMGGPGLGRVGGLAQSVALPAQMLHRIPDGLSLLDAALTEPLAVAVRGVRRARVSKDDPVVVLGAGPIGMLTLAVLHARGVNRVLVVEPNAGRRRAAARRGVHTTEPDGLAAAVAEYFPDGVAAVIECSGHPNCLQQAVDVADYGARIVVVGVPTAPSELQSMFIAIKELSIIGSTAYSEHDFTEALDLLASGHIDTGALISSVVTLDQTDAKLRELASGSGADLKVLVRHVR
jgi:(R,R)-butanediol dehydrogenase/meso-butanediol dehydrogenase/diacetyl reductase